MKRSEQDRLLREILSDDPAEFRHTSLENSLAALRRRRLRRTSGTGLAALAVAAGVFILLRPAHHDATVLVARTNKPSAVRSVPPPEAAPPIKVLNDEELLDLFPEESVGLIGNPGHQTFVIFDQAGDQ